MKYSEVFIIGLSLIFVILVGGYAEAPEKHAYVDSEINMLNAILCWKSDITESNLNFLVEHGVFNLFINVGYPNPDFDPRLCGIVPENEIGILVTEEEVQDYLSLMASVDSRLELWAWFGTYTIPGGHEAAKVDLSTAAKRALIIENIVEVANYGFEGVFDDTEDIVGEDLVQRYQDQVDFWNEEQVALNAYDLNLATFTYVGPSSLWKANDYIPQMNVDYIIAVADLIQPPEVYEVYGPIKDIWINEIRNVFTITNIPIIVDIQYQYGNSYPTPREKLEWLIEAGVSPEGVVLFGFGYLTADDWNAWDEYLDYVNAHVE